MSKIRKTMSLSDEAIAVIDAYRRDKGLDRSKFVSASASSQSD